MLSRKCRSATPSPIELGNQDKIARTKRSFRRGSFESFRGRGERLLFTEARLGLGECYGQDHMIGPSV